MGWPRSLRVLIAAALLPWFAALSHAQDQDTPNEEPTSPSKLNIASWGGAYTQSQQIAFFDPFKKETGVDVSVVTHGGKFGPLDKDGGSGLKGWDLVDMGFSDVEIACRNGLLETIDSGQLAAGSDGTTAREDYLPRTLHKCGVPSVAWSSIIVYDRRAFDGRTPKSASDFFDLQAFPGKRALPKNPRYVLELALLADGVEPNDVYAQLVTEKGLTRALKKLDSIGDDIIWTDNRFQPLELLGEQKVTMATAFSGRVFNTIVAKNQPFGIVWDGQIYELDVWAIPKTSSNKEGALKFIAFATRPDRLAEQTKWFPYGPVRKSALAMVGKHAQVDIDMASYLPTSAANFPGALKFDGSFWASQEKRLGKRFTNWLESPPAETAKDSVDTPERASRPSQPAGASADRPAAAANNGAAPVDRKKPRRRDP